MIDNDINAIHLARQKGLTTKQARELEAVRSCEYLKYSYNRKIKKSRVVRTGCDGDLEHGTASDDWYYRSVCCTDYEICYTTTYSAQDLPKWTINTVC